MKPLAWVRVPDRIERLAEPLQKAAGTVVPQARQSGARKPMPVPRFVARLFAGEAGVMMMTDVRGPSNTKGKRELAWYPAHRSWRQGIAAT